MGYSNCMTFGGRHAILQAMYINGYGYFSYQEMRDLKEVLIVVIQNVVFCEKIFNWRINSWEHQSIYVFLVFIIFHLCSASLASTIYILLVYILLILYEKLALSHIATQTLIIWIQSVSIVEIVNGFFNCRIWVKQALSWNMWIFYLVNSHFMVFLIQIFTLRDFQVFSWFNNKINKMGLSFSSFTHNITFVHKILLNISFSSSSFCLSIWVISLTFLWLLDAGFA